jgi:diguanylate cyclase (GGDEF)-like protein
LLRVAAVAVAVVGLTVSALIATAWQDTVARQRDERLDRTVASRTNAINSQLKQYENALQAERSLWYATSGKVTREDFRRFVHTLQLKERYRGLQSIGWREVVTGGEADAFERAARADGQPSFAIHPSGRRPVYYVMRFGYSTDVFGTRLGLDARTTGVRETLEQARDSGETAVTGQAPLDSTLSLRGSPSPVAFEMVVPVYQNGEPPGTTIERRETFIGWASARFRADDFLKAALSDSARTTGVELHDGEVGPGSFAASFPAGFRAGGRYLRIERLAFAGRSFVLRWAPLPGSPTLTERTIAAPLVFAAGVVVSLLLGGLLWLLAQVGSLYQQVGRLARTDALTGVANRRAWDDEFPMEVARAARSGQPLSVALVDLDHFKAYNDEHGHQAGDRLLKSAAAAWQGKLRKTDLLARYGGEEFAVLLPDCELENAMEIAERLRTAQPEGTCSIGVARWDDGEDPISLIARADRALYAAKEGGRDRCRADPPVAAESAAWTPTS